jgi:SAM-dependent methyltransferase
MARPDHYPAGHERVMTPVELAGLRPHRRALLAGARGRVLDLGGGIGDHFSAYPPSVDVTVLGADPLVRPTVARRGLTATVPIELVDGTLPRVDWPDGSFDTVVTNFVLCSVPSLRATVAEIDRLLAPDGALLFCEHVPGRGLVRAMAGLVRSAWGPLNSGCQLDRDIPEQLRHSGFIVGGVRRFTLLTASLALRSCAIGKAAIRPIPAGSGGTP